MQRLPDTITRAEYRTLRAEPAHWLGVASAIAADHGVTAEPVRPLGGSNLVAALGDADVLKLFPPFLRHQWEAERRALALIQGRVSVATPVLRGEGEQGGWTYLIMSCLAGASLEAVWPSLGEADRRDLLGQIGALIAEVQRVPPGSLVDLEPSWADRLRDQRAGCVARHRERGLPHVLVDDLDRYLDRVADALPAADPPVLLTGEYTPALLEGRGYAQHDLTPRLRDRLMALLLLHRHSDLDVQVRIDGWRERARTLDELAAIVWPH
jgi:hygromycin-B 7''-O-kinase